MVLYVQKYDILPGKGETYLEWAKQAIPQTLAVPGLVEFRGYRPQAGTSQIVVTYEFNDMASWAEFVSSETIQRLMQEQRAFGTNVSSELWGPSPLVPEPLRPGH